METKRSSKIPTNTHRQQKYMETNKYRVNCTSFQVSIKEKKDKLDSIHKISKRVLLGPFLRKTNIDTKQQVRELTKIMMLRGTVLEWQCLIKMSLTSPKMINQ